MLTIDTCTETSTLGLVREGTVLAETAFPSRQTLARRLLPRLAWLLAECGLAKGDVDALAVSLGPGSFTGVRIGLAAAKTLAWGLQKPLLGIPTLDVLAYPFRGFHDALLVPMINARRQQAYCALFRGAYGALQRQTPDLLLSATPFLDILRQHEAGVSHAVLIGQLEGLPPAFLAEAPGPLVVVRSLVTPHAMAALAVERLAHGAVDDPMTLTPIYLRHATD